MNMEFEEYLSDDEELHMAYLNSYDVIVMFGGRSEQKCDSFVLRDK